MREKQKQPIKLKNRAIVLHYVSGYKKLPFIDKIDANDCQALVCANNAVTNCTKCSVFFITLDVRYKKASKKAQEGT